MNTRVMLLIIFTCGFVAMWDQDHTPEESPSLWTLARPSKEFSGERMRGQNRTGRTGELDASKKTSLPPAERVGKAPESETYAPARAPLAPVGGNRALQEQQTELNSIAAERVSSSSKSSLPVPDCLAPGEYRVVDNRGNVQSVSYNDPEMIAHARATGWPVKDFYEYRKGQRRWYYIRIDNRSDLFMAADSKGDTDRVAKGNFETREARRKEQDFAEAYNLLAHGLKVAASELKDEMQNSSRSIGRQVSRMAEETREWAGVFVPVRFSFQDFRDWASRISSADEEKRSL